MKGVIILKNTSKKIISVFLCWVLVITCVLPSVAAVSYPSGVTEQTAEESAEKTDLLIKNALASLQNKTLSELVMPNLYADETLSQILVSFYSSLDEQASSLKNMGINVSTSSVAACLANYPSVSAAVSASSDWQSVNLSSASWQVSDKDGFANAVAAMFAPFNNLFYMLLCGGTYKAGIITLRGDDGYQNGIIPMLTALGCTQIADNETFKAQSAENKNAMIYNIVISVLSSLDEIMAAPATRFSQIMPNLAYYLKNGGFESSVNALMNPLTLGIGNYISLFSGSKMLSVLMFIQDSSKYTTDFSENMTTILNDAIASSEFKLVEIDLDALASCGTVKDDGSVEANIGEAYTTIFLWLFDTLKLNKEKVSQMLSESSEQAEQLSSVVESLLSKESGEIFATLVELLTAQQGKDNDYQWQTPQFTKTEVSYTANLGQEKYQRVLDGIDELLSEFVAEGGEEKSLSSLLQKTIYSPDVISQLALSLYKELSGEEMQQALSVISMSFTPSAVAANLSENQLKSARAYLSYKSSWNDVEEESLDWGFKAGDEKGFKTALTALLRPFEDMLRMLLVSDKIEIFESVNICGSNGYNTAVIPLLEALGCEEETILDYESFKASAAKDGVVENLLTPVLALVDRIIEKPVYTLTEILPNIIFFLSNGSAMQCVQNLIKPLTDVLDSFSISLKDFGIDLEELEQTDIVGKLSEEIPNLVTDVTLEKPNLASLAGIGELTSYTSKAVFSGSSAQLSYVKADQTAVLITLLRYFVAALSNPDNSDLLSSMMGSSDDSNDMFSQYSSGIGEQMAQMSTDETIEWLYKLLFRERAVEQETQDDNYSTAIIYVPQEESHTKQIVTAVIIIIILVIIAFIFRKRIIFTMSSIKQNAAAKKAAGKQEV